MENVTTQVKNTANLFKQSEKYYKRYQDKETDFSMAIDLNSDKVYPGVHQSTVFDETTQRTLKCYSFDNPKGLIVIKDYIPLKTQVEICQSAINNYINKPYRTNMYIYEDKFKNNPDHQKVGEYNKEKWIVNDPSRYHFNMKIRWTNIGKQYDWDNRKYFPEKTTIPKTLLNIAKGVLDVLNQFEDYNPEALIVNFYNWKNYMGGHLDDAEPDQEHPIVSLSMGLSCIFLIGGRTKVEKPQAIRLDSGDVMIMSKEARVCYHGVPRILKESFDQQKCLGELGGIEEGEETGVNDFGLPWNNVKNTVAYMGENRLNINFRQVVLN